MVLEALCRHTRDRELVVGSAQMWLFGVAVGVAAALLVLPLILLRLRVLLRRRPRTLGVLHPYCNDGGGGERVLWVAIRELLRARRGRRGALARRRVHGRRGRACRDPRARGVALRRRRAGGGRVRVPRVPRRGRGAALPGGDAARPGARLARRRGRGDVARSARRARRHDGSRLLLPARARGGVGRRRVRPLPGDHVGDGRRRRLAHRGAQQLGGGRTLAAAHRRELGYYRALAALYAFAGRRAAVVAANGSWTAAHLRELWAGGAAVRVVFPPCDTASLRALPLARGGGARDVVVVLSVAQFRPEKDHALQLRAFSLLRARWRAAGGRAPEPRLVLAGAVRHAADGARLDALRDLARELELAAPAIEFAPNLSVVELRALYGRAAVGLHTMWNEHFGIGVVEMMAAGVVPVAHASGPALDIVGTDGASGLLAATAEEYADALASLLVADGAAKRRATMAAARDAVAARFSEDAFADGFCDAMRPLFT